MSLSLLAARLFAQQPPPPAPVAVELTLKQTPVEEPEKLQLPRQVRWALASLSLSMLMPSLDTSIANVGLPTLAQAFGASFQSVQWIVLTYLLAITTLIVSVGRLGDMVGRRRLLLWGIGLFTVASLLCGLAPSLWILVAARAVQGIGAAMMMALTIALIGETVPAPRLGSAMGLLGTMSAIGTALGHEQVSVRRVDHRARALQVVSEEADRKACRHLQLRARRLRHALRLVGRRRRRERLRQRRLLLRREAHDQ